MVVRDIRLRALRDAPSAFGSTYRQEAAMTDAEWRRRLTGRAVTFLAYQRESGNRPIGLCAGLPDRPGVVELVSMWVDPRARGRDVGSRLTEAVVRWAVANGARHVHLWVTAANEPARKLYLHCGFTWTGERRPLPSDPELAELGMVRTCR